MSLVVDSGRHHGGIDRAVQDDRIQRMQTAPGYGPIVASVYASVMGNGSQYRRGREASGSVGLVPRQHNSGGKSVLLGISKRGDRLPAVCSSTARAP